MKIQVARTSYQKAISATDDILSQISHDDPDFFLLFAEPILEPEIMRKKIMEKFPKVNLHMASSCRGTRSSLCDSSDKTSVTLMSFQDEDSTFCTICEKKDPSEPTKQFKELLQKAVEQSECYGEIPAAVFISCSPGEEEDLLQALHEFFKVDKIPVIGGSSADNTLESLWWSANQEQSEQGDFLCFSLVFSDKLEIFSQFSSGCHITAHKGTVTDAEKRLVRTIDHEPAALVYNRWSEKAIEQDNQKALETGEHQVILAKTALQPIGKLIDIKKHSSYQLLAHPETTDGKNLTLFADVQNGDQIALMEGTVQNLIERPEEIVDSLLKALPYKKEQIIGCVIVFCAGSALALGERVPETFECMKTTLSEIPFITFFSYGEQSCVRNLGYVHGNLMISINLILNSESQK